MCMCSASKRESEHLVDLVHKLSNLKNAVLRVICLPRVLSRRIHKGRLQLPPFRCNTSMLCFLRIVRCVCEIWKYRRPTGTGRGRGRKGNVQNPDTRIILGRVTPGPREKRDSCLNSNDGAFERVCV